MQSTTIETWVWYANIIATAWLVLRLLHSDLWRTYGFLFSYLVIDTVEGSLGVFLRASPSTAKYYFVVYVLGQTAKMALAVFVVLELSQAALVRYPALAAYGRKISASVIAMSAGLAATGLIFAPPVVRSGKDWRLPYFLAFERTLDLGVVLLLLALVLFVGWFPVRLTRNLAYYAGGFSAFFLARYMSNLSVSARPELVTLINIAELGLSLACLIGMAFLMRRRGENEDVVPGHSWDAAAMDRLGQQLDALNASLSRVGQQS